MGEPAVPSPTPRGSRMVRSSKGCGQFHRLVPPPPPLGRGWCGPVRAPLGGGAGGSKFPPPPPRGGASGAVPAGPRRGAGGSISAAGGGSSPVMDAAGCRGGCCSCRCRLPTPAGPLLRRVRPDGAPRSRKPRPCGPTHAGSGEGGRRGEPPPLHTRSCPSLRRRSGEGYTARAQSHLGPSRVFYACSGKPPPSGRMRAGCLLLPRPHVDSPRQPESIYMYLHTFV